MVSKKKVNEIMRLLDEEYGTEYRCYLNHDNAWQLPAPLQKSP